MRLITASAMLLASALAAAPAAGQLEAAAEGPVAIGHHHLNTTDVEASKRFWTLLGAQPVSLGPLQALLLPNLVVALTPKATDAEIESSFGSVVNHIGIQMPDVAVVLDRLRAAGFAVVTKEHVPPATGDIFPVEDQDTRVAFVEAPSGTRIELFENRDLGRPIVNHHIHFYTPDPEATRQWYVDLLGAKPRMRGSFLAADIPGVNLTFSEGDTVATPGRALDHIGFEIRDLAGFVAILERQGVKLDRPYTRIDAMGLSFAFLSDPWGTSIELTEGLDQL